MSTVKRESGGRYSGSSGVRELLRRGIDALDRISIVTVKNAARAADLLFSGFYGAADKILRSDAVFASPAYAGQYSDYFVFYKKAERDCLVRPRNDMAKEKAFRFLLNEYFLTFEPKTISEEKGLFLHLTPSGKFVAIKKEKETSFFADLARKERATFDFLCFLEINRFWQNVRAVKDLHYVEKPLIVTDFLECVDEYFDYIDFLKKQNIKRKIIFVRKR